jgi:hypothetical protein
MRPAVRIIFAPIFSRYRESRRSGTYIHGYTNQPGTRTIYLDPRSSMLGETLLHELIHVRHPSWTEKEVEAETRRRWARMTWKARAKHWRILAAAQLEGEVQ